MTPAELYARIADLDARITLALEATEELRDDRARTIEALIEAGERQSVVARTLGLSDQAVAFARVRLTRTKV